MIVIACHIPFIFFSGKEGLCIIVDELDRKSISSALWHKLQANQTFAEETANEVPPNPDLPVPGNERGQTFNEIVEEEGAKPGVDPRSSAVKQSKIATQMMSTVQTNRLAYKDMKTLYYVLCVLFFYGVQIGMAIIITDIAVVFDFASAIAITCLAFLFPGMFYKLAWKKYGQSKPRNSCDHAWAVAFLIIGVCNFCLGMYSSVNGVIESASKSVDPE